MSDLKFFLWGHKNTSSIKTRFSRNSMHLKQWPDFGFADYPAEYIRLSAILVKTTVAYNKIKQMVNLDEESINHFLYVCYMLQILKTSEDSPCSFLSLKSCFITKKLRELFFDKS